MTAPQIPNSCIQALPDTHTAEDMLHLLKGSHFTRINHHHVYSAEINGEKLFLKIYYNNKPSKEIKRRLGLIEHEAFTEYKAFLHLKSLGVTTIEPVTALSYKSNSFQESLIVTKDFHTEHKQFISIKASIQKQPDQCSYLLNQLSDLIVHLLRNNIFYLDAHLDNFFSNGDKLAIMDGESTFHCPDRKLSLSIKLLDMHARNLLQDLTVLKQNPDLLHSYFAPILQELNLDKHEVYQNLWKRQKRKRLDMYRRLLKGKASFHEVKVYHSPLPHLGLFT